MLEIIRAAPCRFQTYLSFIRLKKQTTTTNKKGTILNVCVRIKKTKKKKKKQIKQNNKFNTHFYEHRFIYIYVGGSVSVTVGHWIQWQEFKSRTRLFVFHFTLMQI